MSFRGELREFELPDIMQLIASQQKAGWLKVISRGRCQFVFFRDGKITSTKNPAEEDDPLEDYIVRLKILSSDQMDRVAALRRKSGLSVRDALEREGLLTPEDIQEIFEAMVEQDIFDLMSIKSGTYEFETEERVGAVPEDTLSADIGPILMEAARKADEVAEMRKSLGPDDGVLVLTPAGREAITELDEERLLLGLVNGVRNIDAILDESELDRYTGTRILFEVARKGWVALLRSAGSTATDPEAVTGEFNLARALQWLGPVLALLVLGVLYSESLDSFRGDDPLVGEFLNRSERLREMDRLETMHLAIGVYRLKNGSLPDSLGFLADDGLVAEETVRDGERARWDYAVSPSGDEYVLLPAPLVTAEPEDAETAPES